MKKWWHYYAHTNNQVIYSLSPFRQDHVGPLLKKMPKNFMKKTIENFPDYIIWAIPAGIIMWADSQYEKDYRATWD
jgi:hypothetical protein